MSATMYGSTAGAGAGQAIFTDDVSLQVFMEHLKRLVSVIFLRMRGEGCWWKHMLGCWCTDKLRGQTLSDGECMCVCVFYGWEWKDSFYSLVTAFFVVLCFFFLSAPKMQLFFLYLLSRARIRRKHGTFVSTWTKKALFAWEIALFFLAELMVKVYQARDNRSAYCAWHGGPGAILGMW